MSNSYTLKVSMAAYGERPLTGCNSTELACELKWGFVKVAVRKYH